jgi:hypothetical protein
VRDVESFTVAMYGGYLKFESLGLLPAEVLVGEVPVLCGLEVDRLGQVELLDNDTRSQIEVLIDDLDKLIRGFIRGAVCIDEDREWLSNTNGVRKLDQCTAGKLSIDQRLGNPAGEVCSRSINLGEILS